MMCKFITSCTASCKSAKFEECEDYKKNLILLNNLKEKIHAPLSPASTECTKINCMDCEHKLECKVPATVYKSLDVKGLKLDHKKSDWSLMPWDSLEDVLKALEYGAEKYSPDNWKLVQDGIKRYSNALCRHMIAYMNDEELDSESGLSHLQHIGANVLFLLWFEKQNKIKE